MKSQDNIFIGQHNTNLDSARDRLLKGNSYKDLSTICIIPTRGMIHYKVVQSWMGLMSPMNQKFVRLFISNMEVGEAYNYGIEFILANPDLRKWKYVLTLEEDNMPPPDGLLKLYEGIGKYDVVSGLYWTKGECGQPMIYGDPKVFPKNFIPQVPLQDTLQQANGLGMGFNLYKLSMFKDEALEKPWFKTTQIYQPGRGGETYTQDLKFYEKASKQGYKFACDTRIKVGHYDAVNDQVW